MLIEVATTVSGPVVVVCMARFELLEHHPEWERGCPTAIALRPLSERDTDAVVEQLVGGALPEAVPRAAGRARRRQPTVRRAGPPHARRRRAPAARRRRLDAHGGADAIEVPPTIEAILAARVDHLGGAERAVAEVASVIGMELWERPLLELAGEGATRSIEGLRRKLVIEPVRRPGGRADMLRFRHLLLRDALYEAIPKARRAVLHERVADGWRVGSPTALARSRSCSATTTRPPAWYTGELLAPGDHEGRLREHAVAT